MCEGYMSVYVCQCTCVHMKGVSAKLLKIIPHSSVGKTNVCLCVY